MTGHAARGRCVSRTDRAFRRIFSAGSAECPELQRAPASALRNFRLDNTERSPNTVSIMRVIRTATFVLAGTCVSRAVLYAKQSYSGSIICEYPEGYVESHTWHSLMRSRIWRAKPQPFSATPSAPRVVA